MLIAVITGVVIAGATGNLLMGILAGTGWMALVIFMDNRKEN